MKSSQVYGLSAFQQILVGTFRLIPSRTKGKMRLARFVSRYFLNGQNVQIMSVDRNRFTVPSLREPIALHCMFNGQYEPELLSFMKQYLSPGDTFIDLGANVGIFSIEASKLVGKQGRVLAIEASPDILNYLQLNVADNKTTNVVVIHKAVIAEAKKSVPFWPAPPDRFGMGALAAQFNASPIMVPADTLDSILDKMNINKVKFIKIDIEGFEASALTGAKRILTGGQPPIIYFEFADWAERRAGFDPGDAQDILFALGYKLFIFNGSKVIRELKSSMIHGSANILAVPQYLATSVDR